MNFLNIPSLPILAAKPKKRTKKCGSCGEHAPSNKSTFCKTCPGQVRNWIKQVKKKTGKGKVCPAEGCEWSTKGNRTHFCKLCGTPFDAHLKRKAYTKSGKTPAKKKQKKQKKQEPTPPNEWSGFDDIDLMSVVPPLSMSRGSSIELFADAPDAPEENWSFLAEDIEEITPDFFDNVATSSEYSEICV